MLTVTISLHSSHRLVMKTATKEKRNGIQRTTLTQIDDLDFADDLALLSHYHRQMQDITTELALISARVGLKINKRKTKILRTNATCETPIMLEGETTQIHLFNTNVKSVLLYGAETWRINKTTLIRIQTFVNHCLRRILRIHWMHRVSNKDLWDRTHQAQIEIEILKRRWGWLGHTLRKPSTNITRQVLTWNPQGKRKGGDQKTPGGVTSRQTSSKWGITGNNWRGLPKLVGAE